MEDRSWIDLMRGWTGRNGTVPVLDDSVHKERKIDGFVVIKESTQEVCGDTFSPNPKLCKDNFCRYTKRMNWGECNWSRWELEGYKVVKAKLLIGD